MIYEADLESHITYKCPGLKIVGSEHPWFSKDVNAGDIPSEDEEDILKVTNQGAMNESETVEAKKGDFVSLPEVQVKARKLRQSEISKISPEVIMDLITRLEGIWAVYEPEISSELIISQNSAEDLTSPVKVKHAIQNEALVAHLKLANMWDAQKMYIEWGAGNALLSHFIQQQLGSSHVVIDRKTPKGKSDRKRDKSLVWKRITIDIKDLVLDLVPELSAATSTQSTHSMCSFSKHLCGAATDLTIRCLKNHIIHNQHDSILIALCCHHRCSWQSYIGREFFEDTLGLTRHDFEIMTRMSSWATSGENLSSSDSPLPLVSEDKTSEIPESERTTTSSLQNGTSRPDVHSDTNALPMTLAERTLWGWRCKRILDVGRAYYMKQLGMETKFRYYVPTEVSLENIVMVCSSK